MSDTTHAAYEYNEKGIERFVGMQPEQVPNVIGQLRKGSHLLQVLTCNGLFSLVTWDQVYVGGRMVPVALEHNLTMNQILKNVALSIVDGYDDCERIGKELDAANPEMTPSQSRWALF